MSQFFEFIANHWILFTLFCIVLAVFIYTEARRALTGVKALEPQTATQLYNREDAQFVDTRSDKDFRAGHLPGAVHYPAGAGSDRLKKLKKDRPVIVYCDTGMRSTQAAQRLQAEGFSNVYHLRGGLNSWRAAGYPLEGK